MKQLLLGCGVDRTKRLMAEGDDKEWSELTTLDYDPDVKPDVEWDLNKIPWPFEGDTFDEVHAYEVLEHFGQQGDWRAFFMHFGEIWRILKPGGKLYATVPMWDSPWAWGDPGHTRIITKDSLIFLDQRNYERTSDTPMTDYRGIWKANFEPLAIQETEHRFGFVLRAVK